MKKEYSRRKFLLNSILAGSAVLGTGFIVSSCNSESKSGVENSNDNATAPVDKCDDYSGVSEAELQKRQSLGYVDETPMPESHCSNCQLYLKPKEGEKCGGCQLFKGPVFANAYCTYWAAQP